MQAELTRRIHPMAATILATDTASRSIPKANQALAGVLVPEGLEGTVLQVEVSADDATWFPLFLADGTRAQITLADESGLAQAAYPLPPEVAPFPYARLVSDEAQAADRDLVVLIQG